MYLILSIDYCFVSLIAWFSIQKKVSTLGLRWGDGEKEE